MGIGEVLQASVKRVVLPRIVVENRKGIISSENKPYASVRARRQWDDITAGATLFLVSANELVRYYRISIQGRKKVTEELIG